VPCKQTEKRTEKKLKQTRLQRGSCGRRPLHRRCPLPLPPPCALATVPVTSRGGGRRRRNARHRCGLLPPPPTPGMSTACPLPSPSPSALAREAAVVEVNLFGLVYAAVRRGVPVVAADAWPWAASTSSNEPTTSVVAEGVQAFGAGPCGGRLGTSSVTEEPRFRDLRADSHRRHPLHRCEGLLHQECCPAVGLLPRLRVDDVCYNKAQPQKRVLEVGTVETASTDHHGLFFSSESQARRHPENQNAHNPSPPQPRPDSTHDHHQCRNHTLPPLLDHPRPHLLGYCTLDAQAPPLHSSQSRRSHADCAGVQRMLYPPLSGCRQGKTVPRELMPLQPVRPTAQHKPQHAASSPARRRL